MKTGRIHSQLAWCLSLECCWRWDGRMCSKFRSDGLSFYTRTNGSGVSSVFSPSLAFDTPIRWPGVVELPAELNGTCGTSAQERLTSVDKIPHPTPTGTEASQFPSTDLLPKIAVVKTCSSTSVYLRLMISLRKWIFWKQTRKFEIVNFLQLSCHLLTWLGQSTKVCCANKYFTNRAIAVRIVSIKGSNLRASEPGNDYVKASLLSMLYNISSFSSS